MVLHITGRRTGRRYDIPVGYHDIDGQRTVVTSAGWRRNLRGGADVEVTLRGRRRHARAALVEDPPAVERVHPPDWMMRFVNPVTRSLLERGRPERIAEQLVILHFRGRRTGTAYDVPVGRRIIGTAWRC